MMLLRHKVITFGGLALSKQQTAGLFSDLVSQYSQVFSSVQTLVFDLAPYLHYLPEFQSAAHISSTLSMLQTEAEACGEDQVRRARILLNKCKLERMLGHAQGVEPHGRNLLQLYLEFSKLDSKPEKGERKIADDFILLFDEVLKEVADAEDRSVAQISSTDLFRIGVLEFALSLSPYNFDI